MNKSDLIQILRKKEALSEKMATDVLDLIFDGFVGALKGGGKIELRGFGSFVVREYNSYIGRNPKSGIKITVKPKKLPFFKAGKELRKILQSS